MWQVLRDCYELHCVCLLYTSEVVSSAWDSLVPGVQSGIYDAVIPGQTEGAKAIGMNHYQTMTSIILPQACLLYTSDVYKRQIISVPTETIVCKRGRYNERKLQSRLRLLR